MPIIFEMPSLSPTMEKGNLVSWCKNEGDDIAVGDVIAEIDTDKATMEVESVYKGKLEKILIPEGTHDVAVRTPIAIIRQKGDTAADIQETLSSLNNGESRNEQNEKNKSVSDTSELDKSKPVVTLLGNEKTNKASPLAKRLASEFGVDISKIAGSGPHGRIVKKDVLDVCATKNEDLRNNEAKYIDEPASSMRKVIAEKLTKTKQDVPHFYMEMRANVTSLLNIRKQINENEQLNTRITVTDLIIKAVALAVRDEPKVNVMWNNGSIRRYKTVDISVAVAVEDGLITPIIWEADKKSLLQISKELKTLTQKAKNGELKPDEFIGGGITVSNLGMFGIDSFFSIINPPQASILSISATHKEPVVDATNQIVASDVMHIGYAIDHRAIDGAVAAKFLSVLSKYLEAPLMTLI